MYSFGNNARNQLVPKLLPAAAARTVRNITDTGFSRRSPLIYIHYKVYLCIVCMH